MSLTVIYMYISQRYPSRGKNLHTSISTAVFQANLGSRFLLGFS